MTASKIFVAGHLGMAGSAIVRALRARGETDIVTRSRAELDLREQSDVRSFFRAERPSEVYLAAAKVGGIQANNSLPADFIYDNLIVQANVINAAFEAGVQRLLFLGSSCIYPKHAEQPMREDSLLTGLLEPTNEPYAIAKIAGIKLCESFNRQFGATRGTDYRSLMPTNLYGPGDNYHPTHSHVIPALIRRFHEAKVSGADTLTVWGTGRPRREFLYVDDLAEAAVHVMGLSHEVFYDSRDPMCSHVNVGSGEDVTIAELAEMVGAIVGFSGRIVFDSSKPDGAPRKLMDSSGMRRLGWGARVGMVEGLRTAYADFLRSSADHTVRGAQAI